ncbi:MAG: DUF4363 family protein [Clostridia bacterium]|nr:DUF4363 family protein [Clostridia bacterium]
MTKVNLIKYFSLAVVLFLLIGISVVEDRLVVSSLKEVKRICYEIESVAEENGGIVNGEVASLVDNLEYSWTKNESKLCFLVNHKSIEQLGIEIVRLKTYIDEEEEIEFFVSLEIIKHYVETFQHFMGASFHNIL